MRVEHPFAPIYDQNSRILILGSIPSVRSRSDGFYYGHPQNRFWKMIASIYEECFPQTIDEKRNFILRHHLALWDVIQACDIEGSSDASIRNAEPTNIPMLLQQAPIRKILCNGQTAGKLFLRFQGQLDKIQVETLPSTSPANASCSLDRLILTWRAALKE